MRAKPFSGKAKKIQLQERKHRKQDKSNDSTDVEDEIRPDKQHLASLAQKDRLVSQWEHSGVKDRVNYRENPAYVNPLPKIEGAVVDIQEFYKSTNIPIPIRPNWTYSMSKGELESREERYFKQWLESVLVLDNHEAGHLGFFEQNLEVWRQLWRVVEISDILVIVADIRFPILHLPVSLYDYITAAMKKPLVLALTKCDLVEASTVESWVKTLQQQFPAIRVVPLSIFNLEEIGEEHKPKRYEDATGIKELLAACDELFPGNKNLLTIGMIGHPNVGKSSLVNALAGKAVVSASKTPGHTKHFQTIFLSHEHVLPSGRYIKLCDSPGIIFPMLVPKHLQILNGLYNVAQVRDPFGALLEAAKLVNLPRILKLDLPPDETDWSILNVCEAYAVKRGFLTAKAARPDVSRSANFLLRMILDGQILIHWIST